MAGHTETLPLEELVTKFKAAKKPPELHELIVNLPFEYPAQTAFLFLGFICLFLSDDKKGIICLVAVSDTDDYRQSVSGITFEPTEYHIDQSDTTNSIAQAVASGQPVNTIDWGTLSRPQTGEEVARLNQANSGIADSVIYPLSGKVKGALMFNYFQYQDGLGDLQNEFMQAYTRIVSEALDNLA